MEFLIPIAGLGAFVMIVDQIRRLIGQMILNGTIRRAIEKDPASVPLLIEKLETRSPFPISLVGWIMLVLGTMMALGAGFSRSSYSEEWVAAATTAGIGLAIVIWDRINRKRAAAALPPTG